MEESDDMKINHTETPSGPEEGSDLTHEEEANGRKRLGMLPVLGLFLLAALLGMVGGAVGGAYGTHYLFPPANMEDLRASVQREMAQAEAKMQSAIDDIRQEMSGLEARLSQTNSESDVQAALSTFGERLQTLEEASAPSLPDIEPETLRALKSAQNDGFKWPETDAIDRQISELTTKNETLDSQIDGLNTQISSLEAEVEALQLRPEPTPTPVETLKPEGPEFPKQALLMAASSRADAQGFLSRTLNKHVSVDSPESPKNLIEKIDTAYAKGDVYTAIKTFDRLPSDIRTAGQDWRDAVDRLK